jgi:assimilatory nitrate reductase catalytic subunit
MIRQSGGIQWPLTKTQISNFKSSPSQHRRLFEDGQFYTSDQRALFCFDEPEAPPEQRSAEFPFILMTGRGSSAQWHTETRTGKSAILAKMAAQELMLDLNPTDADQLGLHDGAKVRVISIRAELTTLVRITNCVSTGEVYLPMHDSRVNQLTHASFDPLSRQPSYKHSAVQLVPA